MSELCSKFQIPALNTVTAGAVVKTGTGLQSDIVKIYIRVIQGDRPESKICFFYAHVQCMSELCCKFQIPASNTVGGVAETGTVLQCYMVKIDMSFKGK